MADHKVLLLTVYTALGLYALKRAHRRSARIVAYFGALVTYTFIWRSRTIRQGGKY